MTNTKLACVLGLFFSLLAVFCDFLVLWHPDLNPLDNNYLFLAQMPRHTFIFGVWVGIFSIMAEVLCLYSFIKNTVSESWTRRGVFLLLFFLVNLGVAYHFMLGLLHDMTLMGLSLMETLTYYVQPLEKWIAFIFILLNLFWFKMQRENKDLKKGLRYYLPLSIFVLGLAVNAVFPELGKMILLCGLNLSIAVFFALAIF